MTRQMYNANKVRQGKAVGYKVRHSLNVKNVDPKNKNVKKFE